MLDFLPLFPLRLVVFPNEKLNLHVFEPRYQQLINDCEAQDKTFGIPAFIDKKMMSIGTELELLYIAKRYPDGKMDIKTRGLGVFEVHKFFDKAPDKLYSAATVERREDNSQGDILTYQKILDQLGELYKVLNIKKEVPQGADTFTCFDIAHHVGFSVQQEYQLLKLRSEVERQEFLYQHLLNLIPIVREMEALRKKIQMNGHFKHVTG